PPFCHALSTPATYPLSLHDALPIFVAYAASLAEPARRGHVVGIVTSGIVLGILLARAIAGALTDIGGWRIVYFVSAILTLSIALDRKSTRLNSSHVKISYAVFCLKK